VWAFVGSSLSNRLMEIVPETGRPAYMAIHNLALNVGILVGSLSAPVLSTWIGLQPAVLVDAGMRFLAGLFLVKWG
jgi:predicted MFS family arabinose efflux permease